MAGVIPAGVTLQCLVSERYSCLTQTISVTFPEFYKEISILCQPDPSSPAALSTRL